MSFLPIARGVFLSQSHDLSKSYGPAIEAVAEGMLDIREPSEVADTEEIEFAVCWQPVADAFRPFPNLKFVMAVGAGVDALLAHPGLPPHLPICRVRDPFQGQQMAGFAIHEILQRERHFDLMAANARKGLWQEPPLRSPADVRVAVLGGGSMGGAVVRALVPLGFSVCVAVRRAPANRLEGVEYLHGADSVARAASGADFLINVLPLTDHTRAILNRRLLSRLAPGGWLIQIGRGEHLVEKDLLELIETGHLAGASLDVVAQEPLPGGHPYWRHPALRITPHVASAASPRILAEQLLDTVREMGAGHRLSLMVDRAVGY